MGPRREKGGREKDLTSRYLSGGYEDDRIETQQRFSRRASGFQQGKIERTALLRAAEEAAGGDVESLPIGQVVQVHSLFLDVEHDGRLVVCVIRKTLNKLIETSIVVGDLVRFRETAALDDRGRPEAVIEQLLPRKTILTRSDSFKAIENHPIVANADQMLIVVSLREPDVKWGLVDRMIVAAKAGGLHPIVCLNKTDLTRDVDDSVAAFANDVLVHYQSLGITILRTSVTTPAGLDELRNLLRDRVTVLAGHSGVGKSTLIRAIQPALDIRIAAISGYTGKGRHTTTSARRYILDFGGQVIDTPGVKLFGLWGLTPDNLPTFFPDVATGTAPQWRVDSYQRIVESLPQGS